MRGKPGHRTAPSQGMEKENAKVRKREQKNMLMLESFTLARLYKDIKKKISLCSQWAALRVQPVRRPWMCRSLEEGDGGYE